MIFKLQNRVQLKGQNIYGTIIAINNNTLTIALNDKTTILVADDEIVKVAEHGLGPLEHHRGYNQTFAPDKLTVGLFLPMDVFQGDMKVLEQQTTYIKQIDQYLFSSLWVRDIPLYDPSFGDVGQVYDALNYLSYLAGQTKNIALGTGSIVLPLWHPIAIAKTVATLDHLSNNRFLFGVGSGDRMPDFPAFGLDFQTRGDRFRQVLQEFRVLTTNRFPKIDSSITQMSNIDLVPKPVQPHVPVLITGASQQNLSWIAKNGDGWITYPGPTTTFEDTALLHNKIEAWRALIPNQVFKPHMTNEWIELDEDPYFPRTPLRGGFILKTGRLGLLDLLNEWQAAGVNHAALGIQFSKRPIQDVIQELGEEVVSHFPKIAI